MNRTVIITGASRGIGKACALRFASEGYNLLINCAKNEALLKETADAASSYGVKCKTYTGDISCYENALEMFDIAKSNFGNVDILVNNAGISSIGLFNEQSPDDWHNIIHTNLDSVYNCSHIAVKDMIKVHSGRIINISSVWGLFGASCEVAYSASKGAINSMTKALAKELAPSNIQVNAVACGAIDTEMNSHLTAKEKEELAYEIPAGRFGSTSEVADTVFFLASTNNYLTGQIIQLDGGWI